MDEGSDFLAVQHLLQVAYDVHIEDVDGQVVLGVSGSCPLSPQVFATKIYISIV